METIDTKGFSPPPWSSGQKCLFITKFGQVKGESCDSLTARTVCEDNGNGNTSSTKVCKVAEVSSIQQNFFLEWVVQLCHEYKLGRCNLHSALLWKCLPGRDQSFACRRMWVGAMTRQSWSPLRLRSSGLLSKKSYCSRSRTSLRAPFPLNPPSLCSNDSLLTVPEAGTGPHDVVGV